MSLFPELPPATGPNLPPGVMPEHPGPLRYPWPEISDAPTPVFDPQTMRIPGFELTPPRQEQLPTNPFIPAIVGIRF